MINIMLTGNLLKAVSGLVNFVPAVAYHFCVNLPEAISQPGNGLLELPCMFKRRLL